MKKIVYILRGVSGCGKNTLADQLVDNSNSSIICSTDDYFIDSDGNYNWTAEKIGSAHKWCQSLFIENLKDNTEIIVVANTSTRTRDVNLYRDLATLNDYKVFVLTVENWHNGEDIHNVPKETKEKMKLQLKNSLKL